MQFVAVMYCSVLQCAAVCCSVVHTSTFNEALISAKTERPIALLTATLRCSLLQSCVALCFSHVSPCFSVLCMCVHLTSCSVLQCVAVCCSVLQCVAVCCGALHCIVLQCVAVRCSVLQCVAVRCIALCCSVWQCVAVCCICVHNLQLNARRCNASQHTATHCNTLCTQMQHTATQCNTLQRTAGGGAFSCVACVYT